MTFTKATLLGHRMAQLHCLHNNKIFNSFHPFQELLQHLSQPPNESLPSSNRHYNENQMYLAESYEDLLATAIINKVRPTSLTLASGVYIINMYFFEKVEKIRSVVIFLMLSNVYLSSLVSIHMEKIIIFFSNNGTGMFYLGYR